VHFLEWPKFFLGDVQNFKIKFVLDIKDKNKTSAYGSHESWHMGFPFTLEFIFENGGCITTFLFFYSYRKLRMSNSQNLASPKSEFYYVKGKRRFRTNKIEQGNSRPLDISKQVQLSKHELSNMRRSQVWTKNPF
jgi:hypothetical protein